MQHEKFMPTDWAVRTKAVDDVVGRMEKIVRHRKRRRRRRIGAISSALAVAAVLFWVVPLIRSTGSIGTSARESDRVILADGSRVELNARSFARTDFRYNRRLVELTRGEAFFSVANDPGRLFVVATPSGTITVLGTRFNVRVGDDGRAEVTLVDGTVNFKAASGREYLMKPGNGIEVSGGNVTFRDLDQDALERRLAWRSGQASFDGDSLASAAERFAAYHGVSIEVSPRIAGLQIGGTYPLADLHDFLAALAGTFPVSVQKTDSGFRILPR